MMNNQHGWHNFYSSFMKVVQPTADNIRALIYYLPWCKKVLIAWYLSSVKKNLETIHP